MNSLELQLCDIQGRLFVLSAKNGYDSAIFINSCMKSNVIALFDMAYNRMQWAGEEYLLEELLDECGGIPIGETCCEDELFWTGYLYRYWHFAMEAKSKEIVKIASPKVMHVNYPRLNNIDMALAIEDLIAMSR